MDDLQKNSKKAKLEETYFNYKEEIEKNGRNEDVKKFAKVFNKLLEEGEYSNKSFANVSNISEASISNYRRGLTMPTNDILNIIAEQLDVSVNHLLGKDECKKYSAQQIHNMLGLSYYAMENLYSLKHNMAEVQSLDDEDPISDVFEEQLKILSLLLADKKFLIYILNSIRKYIKTKEKLSIIKEETSFFEKVQADDLMRDIVHIRAEIQEYLYMSLDDIVENFLKGKK